MSYSSEVLADSPGGYWRMDESSGLPQDSSGNGNHVTTTTTVGTVVYSEAGAIVSDPSSTSIKVTDNIWDVPDHATLDFGNDFTLEFWIKMNSLTSAEGRVLTKQTGAYEVRVTSSGTVQLVRSDAAIDLSSTINLSVDGNFHHCVLVKTSTTAAIYIDNVERGTTSGLTEAYVDNTSGLRIGGYFSSDNDVDAWLDEVAVYQSVLSPTRIAAHYNAALSNALEATPADTLALADARSAVWEAARPQSTTVALTDMLSRAVTAERSFADPLALADDTTPQLIVGGTSIVRRRTWMTV